MQLTKYNSWNFYYPNNGGNNNEYIVFLVDKFIPLIHNLKLQGLLTNFFFVHYQDSVGFHLRLRLSDEIDIRNLEKINTDINAGRYEIIKKKYKREYKRYGGVENMVICERVFECNSELIYKLLYNQNSWTYQNSLFFSLLFNYILLKNNNVEEMIDILDIQINHWKRFCPDIIKNNFLFYSKKYYVDNKDYILQLLNNNKEIISSLFLEHDDLIFYNSFYKLDNYKKYLITDSLIHMSNNRFGVLNQDEALLAYLLKELTSEYGTDLC
jgi:thiopeptide-type bacteriocin biosynthesis protein